ncbi:hypothetical protein [Massilia yuzhufengensis]|nr:hypothetical protein [Massilia yuzhufengensis]
MGVAVGRLGHLMAPMADAFPERYRVVDFPDLALARALALPSP